MLELIAQGAGPDQRWRRALVLKQVEVGRSTPSFATPWDPQVSRRHVSLTLHNGSLLVQRLAGASNPVFFQGEAAESFHLSPGQHFVIGSTTFTLADDNAFASMVAPNPISQRSFSSDFLRQAAYSDSERRISVLNRLPEMIASGGNRDQLLVNFINLLMAGIPTATTIGIVRGPDLAADRQDQTDEKQASESSSIQIIKWDRRGTATGDFRPSENLIRESLSSGESVLHIWNQQNRSSSSFTFDFEHDWAFVCPVTSLASPEWGIYVAGTHKSGSTQHSEASQLSGLQDDLKFCELIGSTLKNLLLVKEFERQNSSFRSFLSPIVMESIFGKDPESVLAPTACQITVMFCDLKGFSKTSEELSDQLFKLLERVSNSLGTVTGQILNNGGVIGDFQGDSVMGFWGWPLITTDPKKSARQAVDAALAIQEIFEHERAINKAESFQVGIGIASGTAVAGKIGSQDQVKVTCFGPVVNLASRLEGMTRILGSGILLDHETFNLTSPLEGLQSVICRLGKFQPFGMKNAEDIYQLCPVESSPDQDSIEQIVESFEAGKWDETTQLLNRLDDDHLFGRLFREFIKESGDRPPSNWDRTIPIRRK
ncbi:MAG: adenylate/guanylate cyclase domain-containing protein [Planctomycetota bacterium]